MTIQIGENSWITPGITMGKPVHGPGDNLAQLWMTDLQIERISQMGIERG